MGAYRRWRIGRILTDSLQKVRVPPATGSHSTRLPLVGLLMACGRRFPLSFAYWEAIGAGCDERGDGLLLTGLKPARCAQRERETGKRLRPDSRQSCSIGQRPLVARTAYSGNPVRWNAWNAKGRSIRPTARAVLQFSDCWTSTFPLERKELRSESSWNASDRAAKTLRVLATGHGVGTKFDDRSAAERDGSTAGRGRSPERRALIPAGQPS